CRGGTSLAASRRGRSAFPGWAIRRPPGNCTRNRKTSSSFTSMAVSTSPRPGAPNPALTPADRFRPSPHPFPAPPPSTPSPAPPIRALLPSPAKKIHRIAIARGINTAENDHGKGRIIMETGRRPEPGLIYPHLGSVVSKLFGGEKNGLPGYLYISPSGRGGN